MNLKWTTGEILPYEPSKILCVGRNYAAHAQELNNPLPQEPLFFIKPSSSLCPFAGDWLLPTHLGEVHYELELALLIGAPLARQASDQTIQQAITGAGLAIDFTLRKKQDALKKMGHPWEIAKAFDRSCALSHFVPTESIPGCDFHLNFELFIHQQSRQKASTHQMLFNPLQLIRHSLTYFSYQPGDILLTGTPEGTGALQINDQLSAQLDSLMSCQLQIT